MRIREVQKRSVWEEHWSGVENKSFLQSWSWGEFQKAQDRKMWRLGVFEDDELVSAALTEKVAARRGTFLLVPHGPSRSDGLGLLRDHLKGVAVEEGASFIRFSPVLPRVEENTLLFEEGSRKAPLHTHPESSWVLDVTPSEDDLIMEMRKSTRYNIRRALDDDSIELREGDEADVRLFSKMHEETARRHGFVPFSEEYLLKEFSSFGEREEVVLYVAEYEGRVGAMAFVVLWSGYGFYHHAVLDPELKDKPLSYGILWRAIRDVKKRGGRMFDFWGYADPQSDHPWAGPTLFKTGFGGFKKEYVLTRDVVVSPLYWFNYVVERVRKVKRGF